MTAPSPVVRRDDLSGVALCRLMLTIRRFEEITLELANINQAPLDPATDMEAALRRSIPSGGSARRGGRRRMFVVRGRGVLPAGANTSIHGAYSRL